MVMLFPPSYIHSAIPVVFINFAIKGGDDGDDNDGSAAVARGDDANNNNGQHISRQNGIVSPADWNLGSSGNIFYM